MSSTHERTFVLAAVLLTLFLPLIVTDCEAQGKPQVSLAEGRARETPTPTRQCEPCSDAQGRCNNPCFVSYCDSKTDYEWRFG